MWRPAPRSYTLAVLAALSGCSLLVDTSGIDAGCGDGMKYCDEKCVSVSEPFYGCTETFCTPCHGDHVVNRCENGACVLVECVHGWGCEGCTANLLTDVQNCGTCLNNCGTGWTCSGGVCVPPDGGRVDPDGAGGAGGSP
jgi:hypothetical protein